METTRKVPPAAAIVRRLARKRPIPADDTWGVADKSNSTSLGFLSATRRSSPSSHAVLTCTEPRTDTRNPPSISLTSTGSSWKSIGVFLARPWANAHWLVWLVARIAVGAASVSLLFYPRSRKGGSDSAGGVAAAPYRPSLFRGGQS